MERKSDRSIERGERESERERERTHEIFLCVGRHCISLESLNMCMGDTLPSR